MLPRQINNTLIPPPRPVRLHQIEILRVEPAPDIKEEDILILRLDNREMTTPQRNRKALPHPALYPPRRWHHRLLRERKQVRKLPIKLWPFSLGSYILLPGYDTAVLAVLVRAVLGEVGPPEHARGGFKLFRVEAGAVAWGRGAGDGAGAPAGVDEVPVVWGQFHGVPGVAGAEGGWGAGVGGVAVAFAVAADDDGF